MRVILVWCKIYVIFKLLMCLTLESVLARHNEDSLSKVQTFSNISTQQDAAVKLITRVIGNRSNDFRVTVNPQISKNGKEVFKVLKSQNGSFVEIEGSSGVAVAWGFHHYLKYHCSCHISWNEDQLNLPNNWPSVNIKKTANDRFRYHQNVCTWSYSYVWWGWEEWERHIDWMALNGINLVLAFNGQEAIWQRVYTRLNMTSEEIDQHFTGPAFLAWGRMGNIRGWSGPLSEAWHNHSLSLQKLTLNRMKSLGIIPVLPAFAGHVPRAFKRLFPTANFTLTTCWNTFEDQYCCPYLLSPQEPLFKVIGSMFLEEMIKEFGTNHIYNCDTFNEMTPSSGDLDFLRQIGKSIYDSMTQVDPDAIWMLQGWIFHNEPQFWNGNRTKALLTSVPIGKMLILDLMSELDPQYARFDSYFGQPFIWCMLHNFGGTLGMHGTAKRINEDVFKARNTSGSSMVGIGITMEGLNPNYVLYDLMLEMGWREEPADLTVWFKNYSVRRNGQDNVHLDNTWQRLKGSVYDYKGTIQQHGRYIVVTMPSLNLQPDVWYDTADVMEAWDETLKAVDVNMSLAGMGTFKHDLVDLTRQALQLKIDYMYQQVVQAYNNKDEQYLSNATGTFLELMGDIDKILASNKWFLLGSWLEAAKKRASSIEEQNQFEEMARNQITLWGPNGEIRDYACKQWANLMSDFYTPRWEFFFQALKAAVVDQKPFNQQNVSDAIFREIELPFTVNKDLYPTFEIGDSVDISKRLHKKWRNLEVTYYNQICTLCNVNQVK